MNCIVLLLLFPFATFCERLGATGWRGLSSLPNPSHEASASTKSQRSLHTTGNALNQHSYSAAMAALQSGGQSSHGFGGGGLSSGSYGGSHGLLLNLDSSKSGGYNFGGQHLLSLGSGQHGSFSYGDFGKQLGGSSFGHNLGSGSFGHNLGGGSFGHSFGGASFGHNLGDLSSGHNAGGVSFGHNFGSGSLDLGSFGGHQHMILAVPSHGQYGQTLNIGKHGGYVSGFDLGGNLGGSGSHQSVVSLKQGPAQTLSVDEHQAAASHGNDGGHSSSGQQSVKAQLFQSSKIPQTTKLQATPDIQNFGHKYTKVGLQDLGEVSHKKPLTKLVKIFKTFGVKVPVHYPVKVPHHIPVPVPVHKPYPVAVPTLVKVPHPVPVEVPIPVEVKKENTESQPHYQLGYQQDQPSYEGHGSFDTLAQQMSQILSGGYNFQSHEQPQYVAQSGYSHQIPSQSHDTYSQQYSGGIENQVSLTHDNGQSGYEQGHEQQSGQSGHENNSGSSSFQQVNLHHYNQQASNQYGGEQQQSHAQQQYQPSVDSYAALAQIKQSIENGLHSAQQSFGYEQQHPAGGSGSSAYSVNENQQDSYQPQQSKYSH